jgi:hypothetical protein
MALFKKKDKQTNTSKVKDEKQITGEKEQVKKTKKRIGIGIKKEKKSKKRIEKDQKNNKENKDETEDVFEDIVQGEDKKTKPDKIKEAKKKQPLIKKDLKGKPVYLEDTGEKLGVVFETICNDEGDITGYKIKDQKSDTILTFPFDQFNYDSDGLIFVPSWYTNAVKTIEKLEFKDKISPELTALLSDDDVSNEELYDIFVKYDDEMVNYIDESKSLRGMLNSRLKVLEKQRVAMKNDLIDLTEKRLIKDIDRREFSEDVMEHRRKVNVLDLNIKKCKDLLKRLDKTSFGVLGKNHIIHVTKDSKVENNLYERVLGKMDNSIQTKSAPDFRQSETQEYKQKYLTLKAQYEQLEEDYQELKLAVDKLFAKEEL